MLEDTRLLHNEIDRVYPDTVRIRRVIHQNPELSGNETRTAQFVSQELRVLGLTPRLCVDKTGVVASIDNGKGPVVALRADTDALPIQEETALPFASQVPGVMHACGHDMHTAILLGAASVLTRLRAHWSGKVVLLFQPSEEVEPGGAVQMMNERALPKGVHAIFGLHVNAEHQTGTIGIRPGPDYAGVLTFDVVVKGRGGHGAAPDKTIDPIVCAASMIMQLQTLVSRERPPFEPAVLTVGTIHAGTRRNIIPDEARFQGTIRTHSERLQNFFKTRVSETLDACARSFRAGVDIAFEKSYPPSFNDPSVTNRAADAFSRLIGPKSVQHRPHPTMYAEDFAYFLQKIPGLYAHLGTRPPRSKSTAAGIHSARFSPDETSMKTGIAAHVVFAMEFTNARA